MPTLSEKIAPLAPFVPKTIVFVVGRGHGADALLSGHALVDDLDDSGLAQVTRLVRSRSDAVSLTTIRSESTGRSSFDATSLAIPNLPPLYVLQLADDEAVHTLLDAMGSDSRILSANRPSLGQPMRTGRAPRAESSGVADAGSSRAAEPYVVGEFDVGDVGLSADTPPVTVIDFGLPDPDAFEGRLTWNDAPNPGMTNVTHGLQVAGVLGVSPNSPPRPAGVPRGCCEAQISYSNVLETVGQAAKYSAQKFHYALSLFVKSQSRVLNLSMHFALFDKTIADELDRAEQCGKVVVAAMPDESSGAFPCEHETVIGVGSVAYPSGNAEYSPHPNCSALLSSFVFGLSLLPDGSETSNEDTSFAAPSVTAAVWLALAVRPTLKPRDVRALLVCSSTAFANGARPDRARGWGAVNARRLVHLAVSGCP